MSKSPNEQLVEDVTGVYFGVLGIKFLRGAEIDDSGDRATLSSVVLSGTAKSILHKLNPHLPDTTIDAVVSSLSRPPHPTLIENNRHFHRLLTDGVPVEYKDAKSGEMRGGRARVIDFDNPGNNDFLVVRQLTIASGTGFQPVKKGEKDQRQDAAATGRSIRTDLILYVNGLPLVVIELKDPADTSATLDIAIDQLGRYMQTAPDLFVPNLVLVASDGLLTRVGSITSGRQRFTPWRPASGGEPTLEALIRELLAPEPLLDYLRSCVVFEEDERGNIVKKVAGYHQFRAIRKTRASVLAALVLPPLPLGEGRGEGAAKMGEGAATSPALLPADILLFARELRRNQTDAEELLWSILRDRRLGDFKFRRQHPLGRHILDFYCHEAKLSIELDGGQHNTEDGRRHDEKRTQAIVSQGILELRFWNHEVLQETDAALEAIWNALQKRAARQPRRHPHPGPLPRGEGEKTERAKGQGGVVWHTQGSGKSLTMLMLAGTLVRAAEMANPTLVIVTDRNDLDDQLFDTFAMGRDLLRQEPVQADSRDDLKKLLDRASGGVVFTTIHKFTESHGKISERSNVVVMADEAHRSQYGFVDGGAKWMRDALPNATFVGFTGTPLMAGDKVTRHVFGEYADVYDIRQAVADGATVPIYYEPRIVKLTIDEAGAQKAEAAIAEAAKADAAGEEAAENIRIPIEELYGAPERLERVAKFLVEHWEQRRSAMEGKAMVVTMSRDIAARLHDEIAKLRPAWVDVDDDRGVMKVIMTGGPEDPEHMAKHVRSKAQRKALAARFKDPADDFRVAIVVDMWLTGFDVPCAHTMYLDKPLAGHNLMQAIARVNRVYGEKPGGLIVDLIGLADPLADALAMYANATGESDKPIKELQDEAIPAMRSAFEQLRDFFHGYDYSAALQQNTPPSPRGRRAGDEGAESVEDADFAPQQKPPHPQPLSPEAGARGPSADLLKVYLGAVDHVLDVGRNVGEETGWKRFRGMVKRLSTAFALAVPREETKEITPHLAFFQRISAMIRKRLADDAGPTPGGGGSRDIDAAVRQVIGDAVDAGEVIDLFGAAGLDAARLDILSEDFLNRVSALEQKNLALETLRKLLTDQIKISERTNLVQAQKFREALEKAMLGYTNKQITTAEMIAKLLELANWVREAKQHGQDLGLSTEEVAFYDALAENGSAKEVMQSDQLRLMARELAEMVKKMPKLDWTQRESVRADLRRKVRRLLAMYGYPPDLSEDATQLVLKQAELSTEAGE